MATLPLPPRRGTFGRGFLVQMRVIGALLMRELHTRYGRENLGYLWMIGEPMLLATVVGGFHFIQGHSNVYGTDIKPMPFAILGYVTFIVFRGIVNRSEGTIETNGALLYHRMVTIEDIAWSRILLESGGVFMTMVVMMGLMIGIGQADWPARPLNLLAGWALIIWYSAGHTFFLSALTYGNHTIGRLVHPYTYFMVFLSGAFMQVKWLPLPFREWILYNPLVTMFELVRNGWFESANLDYFYPIYAIGACMVLHALGLYMSRQVRSRIHLQ